MNKGFETWESLEKAGLAAPPKPMPTQSRRQRMRDAIEAIVANNEYPSIRKITLGMGRRYPALNSEESQMRRELFEELGIEMATRGPDINR